MPVTELDCEWKSEGLTVSKLEMVASLTHMHVNRILAREWREQEFVIFDMLRRHYHSELAQLKVL